MSKTIAMRDQALIILGIIGLWQGCGGNTHFTGNGFTLFDEPDGHDIGIVHAPRDVSFIVSIIPAGVEFTEIGQWQRTCTKDRVVVSVVNLYAENEPRFTIWASPRLPGPQDIVDGRDIRNCLHGWFAKWQAEQRQVA